MMTLVQFGAGNIGRGFMGQLFWEAGFRTIFVDADPRLVELLNARKAYTLRLLDAYSRDAVELQIDRFEAVHTDDLERIREAIAEAGLIGTAVGVRSLPLIAPAIAAGIRARCEQHGPPIDVWLCENLLGAAGILREQVEANLVGRCLGWANENVGFVGTAVARMVPSLEGDFAKREPLLVVSDAHHELPYDASALRSGVPQIAGLQPAPNFAVEMERKLYTHNLGHAALAYLGKLKGYRYVHESLQDPSLSAIFDQALDETAKALCAKYPQFIDADEHARIRRDVRIRFGNPMIMDTVQRVAKDPLRKLGREERLIGSAELCLSQGIFPDKIATVCAAALRYEDAGDPDSQRLQRMIRGQGIAATIAQVTGLDPESALSRSIAARYLELGAS